MQTLEIVPILDKSKDGDLGFNIGFESLHIHLFFQGGVKTLYDDVRSDMFKYILL